jgi:hypothetical protein
MNLFCLLMKISPKQKWWKLTWHHALCSMMHFPVICYHPTNKMCYETQMPPYEANSRDGHNRQNPRSRFQNLRLNIKVVSQGTCIWNTKALSLTIQKIWPKLNFLKSGLNFKVKVTRSNIMVPLEWSCHKEHTYETWKPYHLPFKRYGQC